MATTVTMTPLPTTSTQSRGSLSEGMNIDPTADWQTQQAQKNKVVSDAQAQARNAGEMYTALMSRMGDVGRTYDQTTKSGLQNMQAGFGRALQGQGAAAGAGSTGMFATMLQGAKDYGSQSNAFLAAQNQAKQQAMYGAQDQALAAKQAAAKAQTEADIAAAQRGTEGQDVEASSSAAQSDIDAVLSDGNNKIAGRLVGSRVIKALNALLNGTTDVVKQKRYRDAIRDAINGAHGEW